jgi:flagellar biogenesis protein FliO
VLSTTSLGPRHQVHLVRVGDDVLLLGAMEHGLRTLHHVRHDAAVAQGLLADEDVPPDDAVFAARTGAVAVGDGETAAGLLDTLRRRTAR